MKTCPDCARVILGDAATCPHCGRRLGATLKSRIGTAAMMLLVAAALLVSFGLALAWVHRDDPTMPHATTTR